MSELTMDQITAAQGNDLTATTAVIQATDGRVTTLATKAAMRMAPGSGGRGYIEEFTQVGRIAVWQCLPRFTGESVDSFYAFVYGTVEHALTDAVRAERNTGADRDAVKVFGSMLKLANGDVYLAEKLAQTVPPKGGRRLSADRANAARMAWQGTVSVDLPTPRNDGVTTSLGDTLATDQGLPEDSDAESGAASPRMIRRVVRDLESMVTVPQDSAERFSLLKALSILRSGKVTRRAVNVLGNHMVTPRNRADRLAMLNAFAVLEVALRHADSSAVPEDLVTSDDLTREERRIKIAIVHGVLDLMSDTQRTVLSHSYGIRGAVFYGCGANGNDGELAAMLNLIVTQVQKYRTKGTHSFAKRYIAAVATSPEHAAQLTEIAAGCLSGAGRK